MRPELERLIEKLNLKDHVRLAGWMSNDQVRAGNPQLARDGAAELRRRACRW